jgi:hypothetical protein
MEIDQQIRMLAARGEGKAEVMRTLNLSRYYMDLYCSAMPDIVWPRQGCALGNKRGNEAQKGYFPPRRKEAQQKAVEKRKDNLRKYEICGVRGTIKELYDLWAEHISVGRQRVTSRLSDGYSVYDAFFLPKQKSVVDLPIGERKKMYNKAKLGVLGGRAIPLKAPWTAMDHTHTDGRRVDVANLVYNGV